MDERLYRDARVLDIARVEEDVCGCALESWYEIEPTHQHADTKRHRCPIEGFLRPFPFIRDLAMPISSSMHLQAKMAHNDMDVAIDPARFARYKTRALI